MTTGGISVLGTVFEHGQLLNYPSHDSLGVTLDSVQQNSAPSFDVSPGGVLHTPPEATIVMAGGRVPFTIRNSRIFGNLDLSSFNTGVGTATIDNLTFLSGTVVPPASGAATWTSSAGYFYGAEADRGDPGVVSVNRILAAGSTLGPELVTDGDMEAAGVGSWPNYGSPTSVAKNTVTPIAGTQDLHVVTSGTGSAGVQQSLGAFSVGDILLLSWIHYVPSGSLGVEFIQSGAPVKLNYYEATYPVTYWRQNEPHSYYYVVPVAGTYSVGFTNKSGTPTEFYVDSVSVKKVTAGGIVAANDIYASTIHTGKIITTSGPLVGKYTDLVFGATVNVDASQGNSFGLSVPTSGNFSMVNPTNLTVGQVLNFPIANLSGGAMGTVTWDSQYYLSTFTNPGSNKARMISFLCTAPTYLLELSQSAGDITLP